MIQRSIVQAVGSAIRSICAIERTGVEAIIVKVDTQ
ncbi:hypothetical protein GGQ90_005548 [Sphingobium scionense]|uniref:Uncharacterized protein n=1 Tax=Sphingobium scionense TaxID=1404341 RepID=A0A7W6LWK6_9SPHN|nr:hypothetical protein [Sphingobium scionense]